MSNTIYTKYTQQPSETQPSETQPSEKQPSEKQPSEKQPSETQPSETQEVSDNVSSYIDYFFNREDIDKLFHR